MYYIYINIQVYVQAIKEIAMNLSIFVYLAFFIEFEEKKESSTVLMDN